MSKFQLFFISLSWDILVSVKTYFDPFRGFWLVTMATGYHFEFFMTFLKLSINILSIWTQVIGLRVLSKLWGYSPLNESHGWKWMNPQFCFCAHLKDYWHNFFCNAINDFMTGWNFHFYYYYFWNERSDEHYPPPYVRFC